MLFAVIEITPGIGAIPVVHAALPAPDVAVLPGTTVIVQEAPAARTLPLVHAEEDVVSTVVPVGQVG